MTGSDEHGHGVARLVALLLPVAILIGRNWQLLGGTRPVYLGPTELLVAVGVFWLVAQWAYAGPRDTIPRWLAAGMIAMTAAILLSNAWPIITGAWSGLSVSALVETTRWIEHLALVPIVLAGVRTRDDVRRFLLIAGACLIASVIVALYQASTFNFGQSRIYGLFRSASDVAGLTRSNPNAAGTLFMFGALYFAAFASVATTRRSQLLAAAALMTSAVATMFTLSRSSTMGMVLGLLLMPLWLGNTRGARVTAIGTMVLVLGMGFYLVQAAASIAKRVLNTFDFSIASVEAASLMDRFTNWRVTLDSFGDYWFAGIGYGRFSEFFPMYTPDNLYLEILAGAGLIGLAAFLVLMLANVRLAIKRFPASEPLFLAVRAAHCSLLAAVLLVSLTGAVLLSPRVLGCFWLSTALLIRVQRLAADDQAAAQGPA
jgi:O-antigen ligase